MLWLCIHQAFKNQGQLFSSKLRHIHIARIPPPFIKGWWDFLKMAVMGVCKIFTKNGGKGVGFIIGVGESFSNFSNPLFQILSTSPHFPVTSKPPSHCSFCFPVFFGWMGDHATFDVPFYLMIIWHIMWFFTGTLIWYHTQRNTNSTLRGQQTDRPI